MNNKKYFVQIILPRIMPYVEDTVGGNQWESEHCSHIQGAAFNVTHFERRITHLLYTAINTTEHG
jgi:hypothetical protein